MLYRAILWNRLLTVITVQVQSRCYLLVEANSTLEHIFLDEHQSIQLPELTKASAPQTLKLWD
jgi:hypothetical protein